MGGSGVIPGWKVKRELTRLGQQLKAIPEFFWEPFAIRAHNAAFEKGFPSFDGQVPALPKIAIVLCYQPKGLAKSFFITLAHLVKNGYAPLVISNSKLSDDDKEKLKPMVWRVVERPNFGYDFGGYRDGIFLLRKWNISPERLVIMNDSIWYPVWEHDTTLQKAEASEFDVVGMVMREKGDLRYLESYFFMASQSVWHNVSFQKFWDSLRITSNKYKVIRRGERFFGRYLSNVQISFGPLFSRADFDNAIMFASDAELRLALRYISHQDQDLPKKGLHLAGLDMMDWRNAALDFLKDALQKHAFNQNFQVAASQLLGYPIIKKSNGAEILKFWRSAWLRAYDDGTLPKAIPQILTELREKVDRDRQV